jgi:hypothetical protein
MNMKQTEETQLNFHILLEEFRYWDASRNNVPKIELEKIKSGIKKMKGSCMIEYDTATPLTS